MDSEWETCSVGDLGKIVTGNTPPKAERGLFREEHHLWIKPRDIGKDSRYVQISEEYYSKAAANRFARSQLPKNATCVVTLGTVGDKLCLTSRPCFTNQDINAIVPDTTRFDPIFIYYLMKFNLFQVAHKNTGTDSGRHHVSKSNFSGIRVRIPALVTQHKIAAILSAYDDLIESNVHRVAILEEVARALYHEWFVEFRFPGHEQATMVEGPDGQQVPEGWTPVVLDDLVDIIRKTVDPSTIDPDTPYIGLEHMPRRSIALTSWGRAEQVQSTKHIFRKFDILFGKIRPYFHKVGIAPINGICSSDIFVFRVKEQRYFGLVVGCVSSSDFVDHASQTSQGTKMPRANWDVLKRYTLLIPPASTLEQFNSLIVSIDEFLITKIHQNNNLRATRDLLLPRLIEGEVDVADLDIPIPEVTV